jgi:ribosomal protein L40E
MDLDWGAIIITLLLDLILTVFFYLLVPVIFCIRKKSMTQKQIKKVIIINAICVALICGIIAGKITGAVFLWSWVGEKIMKRVLLIEDEANEPLQENQSIKSAIVNKPIAFCRKCGAKLNDNSAFCSKCGTKVSDK